MRKLLLADDEAYVTTVLARKLAPMFDAVLTAGDGEEAFELARRESPILVVSDYQMPGTDGYQLALKLRNCPSTAEIPMILLTARGHLLTAEQIAATSIRTVLAKPFSVRELSAAIVEVLGTAGQSGATAA
jgi:CheY-like chemotaxis protein